MPNHYLVNLSSLHTLESVDVAVAAFSKLSVDHYSAWQAPFLCCVPPSLYAPLHRPFNYLATQWTLHGHQAEIRAYKLGEMTTEEFLKQIYRWMEFDRAKDPSKEEMDFIFANREAFRDSLSVSDRLEYAFCALSEEAWNTMLTFHESDYAKFERLQELAAQGNTIYLIGNTNAMHVAKILRELRRHFPNADWLPEKQMGGKCELAQGESWFVPLTQSGRIVLAPSYRAGLEKTANPKGDSLMARLRREALKGIPAGDIHVVSQFQADLTYGERQGFYTYSAQEFFAPSMAQEHRVVPM